MKLRRSLYARPEIRPRTALHQRCQLLLAEGELERCHRGVVACHRTGPCQKFARNYATRNLAPPHSATLGCSVAWAREVLRGVVNSPRINGMDGIAGSTPKEISS